MPISITVRAASFLLTAAVLLGCPSWPASAAAAPTGGMVEVTLQGRKVEGAAIGGAGQELRLLGRDGRLWQFDPDEVQRLTKISTQFRPYSPSEFRAALLRELGGDYEVSGTSHYLVAHPAASATAGPSGSRTSIARSSSYFSVRGFQPAAPPFPLVGIVWKNRGDFARHASPGGGMPNGVAGYYDLELEPDQHLRHGRTGRLGQLASERGRVDPRSHAPDGVQHGHPQPILPAAALAGRGAGDALRGPRRLRFAQLHAAGRSRQPRPAARLPADRWPRVTGRNCWPRWWPPTNSSASTRRRPTPRRGR